MAKGSLKFLEVKGREAERFLPDLASLRIKVFRDFPYLYEGDLDYERRYLHTYFSSGKSFVILCIDGEKVVGASTAMPLAEEEDAFKEPFLDRDMDPSRICYYGESVLLPAYRGRGVGKHFMEARESYARSLSGVDAACFCSVVRPEDHPQRPAGYRSLDGFWNSFGFRRLDGFVTEYKWKELGQEQESAKPMQFWWKELR